MQDRNGQLFLDFGCEPEPETARKPDWKNLPRFDSPANDNERLLNFQWEFRNGKEEALAGMYELGLKVSLRLIDAKARGNRHVARLSAAERREKAHNAITYIITRYLRKPEWRITDSFTAYLYLRVQHELFYRRKVDGIVDFVDWQTFRK